MRRGPYRRGDPKREAIVRFLRDHPGANRGEVARGTGFAWSVVAHHVGSLLARGEVAACRRGNRAYYRLAVADAGAAHLVHVVRMVRTEPGAGRLLALLNRTRATTIQRLSDELGVDRKVVRRQLRILQDAGMVGRTPALPPRLELRSIPLALRPAAADAACVPPSHGGAGSAGAPDDGRGGREGRAPSPPSW